MVGGVEPDPRPSAFVTSLRIGEALRAIEVATEALRLRDDDPGRREMPVAVLTECRVALRGCSKYSAGLLALAIDDLLSEHEAPGRRSSDFLVEAALDASRRALRAVAGRR